MQRVLETVTSRVVFWSDVSTGAAIRSLNRATSANCTTKELLRCFQRNCNLIENPELHYMICEQKLMFAIESDDLKLLQHMVELELHLVLWEEAVRAGDFVSEDGSDMTICWGMYTFVERK